MERFYELDYCGFHTALLGVKFKYTFMEYIERNPYGSFSVEFSLS
jgi:hypothetical protein